MGGRAGGPRASLHLDDVDGSELPDDTQPLRLVHEGLVYGLYLSREHRKELLDTLDVFTAHSEPLARDAC